MFDDLIEYDDFLEYDAERIGFGNVTMLDYFGPLKKGEKYDSLWFLLEESRVNVFMDAEEQELVHDFGVKIVAADMVRELQDWKKSAMSMLADWEKVWEAAGRPGAVGSSKAESVLEHMTKKNINIHINPNLG